MDDAAALRATIAAHPEADLPRLVYADWLEDRGDDAQAAFVRTQVELAGLPAWSPLAVRRRHHAPELLTGKPWRRTLPDVSPRVAAWHTEMPFRRGAPDWLVVRDLASFLDDAERLFALAPITTLSLPTSSLGYWQDLARRPWLRQVRALHFYSTSTPIEPLRVLGDALNAAGVESLTLEKCSGPAFPVVLAGLFASPLGTRIRRLDLRVGGDNNVEWVEALEALPAGHPLEALDLTTMELGGRAGDLAASPVFARLGRFGLHNDRLEAPALRTLTARRESQGLADFALTGIATPGGLAAAVASGAGLTGVRRIDLTENPVTRLAGWAKSSVLAGVRSLSLRRTKLTPEAVRTLTRAPLWPGLAELDLRGVEVSYASVSALLDAAPPPGLAAFVLSGEFVPRGAEWRLHEHFGGAVVFGDG